MIAVTPAVVPVLLAIHGVGPSSTDGRAWTLRGVALLIALLLGGGSVLWHRRPRVGRTMFVSSVLGFGAVGVLGLPDAPFPSFVVALGAVTLLALVPSSDPAAARGRDRRARGRIASASWSALAVTLGLAAFAPSPDPLAHVASLLPAGFVAFEGRILRRRRQRVVAVGTAVAAALGVAAQWSHPGMTLLIASGVPVVMLLLMPDASSSDPDAPLVELWSVALLRHPARLLMATFALVGIAGGVALTTPAASAGEPLTVIDGMFTAFSAVCVTGLIVVDTPVALSSLGEGIVLALIQIGGLGIMTFTTAAFLAMGNLGVRNEKIAASLLASERPRASLLPAVVRVIVVSVIAELLGALLLTLAFIQDGDAPLRGLWRGVFTAISAYCNAGFALQSDSLVPYASQPAVLWVVSALIFVGGLGPAVVVALPRWVRGRSTSLMVRVVMATTLGLLVVPTLLFLAIEWNGVLAGMSLVDRLTNAWFLSVTTRTAGFNSVDMASLAPATLTLVILLMAIGGSPGSTAGGLKTTTVAVLVAASVATARGASRLEISRRAITDATVRRALAATGTLVLAVGFTLVFIQLTQALTPTQAVFEVVSAVATVGLSVGATAELDEVGRVAITILMLVGRVGPLTFLGGLLPVARPSSMSRPVGELSVG